MCSECVQSVLRVCSECVQNVFRVCQECVKSVFRVCSEYVSSMFNFVVISSPSASKVTIFNIFRICGLLDITVQNQGEMALHIFCFEIFE